MITDLHLKNMLIPFVTEKLEGFDEIALVERKVLSELGEGLFQEAPLDDKMYVRKGGQWIALPTLISTDVPKDNKLYLRKDGEWVEKVFKLSTDKDFSSVQDGSVTIFFPDLIPPEYPDYNFSGVKEDTISGAEVEVNHDGGYIVVTPTVPGGGESHFEYEITSPDGETSVSVSTTVTVTRLPDIEGYFFDSLDDAVGYMESFTPPTLGEVFNSWARFSNWTSYYPSGTTASGEAAAWEMISETQFRCTVNSTTLTGFVSPKTFTQYTHEATLSSTDSDDDCIALILAYKYEDGKNKVLCVGSSGNTDQTHIPVMSSRFGIFYYDGQTVKVLKQPTTPVGINGGWNVISPTRIYANRNNSVFQCKCSQFKSTTYDNGTFIQIDLNDYPELSWALEPSPYGYTCISQRYSSFTDVVFAGGLDTKVVISIPDSSTYRFENGVWKLSPGETPQSIYGFPRYVLNPETGSKYEILENEVIKVN